LIHQARPEADAPLIAHILLGSLHAGPVAQLIRDGESTRLRLIAATLLELRA
jgi:hypothetical protein